MRLRRDWCMWTTFIQPSRSIFCSGIYWLAGLSSPRVPQRPDLVAEFAGAADRADAEQFDPRRKVLGARRLFVHQGRAEIFLVVVAEDGHDDGFRPKLFLSFDRSQEIASGRDAHGKSQRKRQFLSHQDGISIGNGKNFVEFLEAGDFRNELVSDSFNSTLANSPTHPARCGFLA